jgi:dihydroneopterin aldolase
MKYTTLLTGLEFFSFHGLYAEEKMLGGTFFVDVSVECEIDQPISSIENATNYEIIFNTVKAQMTIPQELLETVAQHIIVVLKHEFPRAGSVEVTIHKPNPAGLFKSGVASVRMSG